MDNAVRIEKHLHRYEITLDRPKANAIDVETSKQLYAAFHQFQNDPEARVAIITAAGERFFSAGWDLKAASEGEAVDASHGPGGFAGLTEYHSLDKPVIAAVNGLAVGGGFELALAADLIVCVEHAQFFLPEVGIGIMADSGGVLRLPKHLPRAIANQMLLTGERLDAQKALQLGLVNDVTSPDRLMERARELADAISANAPLAIRGTKAVLRATETLNIEAGFDLMRSGAISQYDAMLQSEDAREGSRAFAEGRAPIWSGK